MVGDSGTRDHAERPSAPMTDLSDGQAAPPPVKPTRSYRACINCRTHKTKCDLGDVNNPISPPCSRCKRERKECVFGESRRGGRANIEAGLAKRKATSEAPRDSSEPSGGARQGDTGKDGEPRSTTVSAGREGHNDNVPLYSPLHATGSRGGPRAMPYAAVDPSIQPTQRQVTGHMGDADPRFSTLAAYDTEASYIPVFGSTIPTVPRPYAGGLAPRRIDHSQGGSGGFPMNMNDIDMSFVFNDRNGSELVMDNQNGRPPPGSLPSVDFAGQETADHNIPTGPSFSGFFASPGVQPEASAHPNPAMGRQADSTPQGIPSDPEHHIPSSHTRRLSNSTADSAKKDRDHKNEKLALKDPRSFVINAGMHNESDALQILAMAAETQNTKKRKRDVSAQAESPNVDTGERVEVDREMGTGSGAIGEAEDSASNWHGGKGSKARRRTPSFRSTHEGETLPGVSRVTFRESSSSEREDSPTPPPDITHFFLVEQGIVDPEQVHSLCRAFFEKHHHYFVSIPYDSGGTGR